MRTRAADEGGPWCRVRMPSPKGMRHARLQSWSEPQAVHRGGDRPLRSMTDMGMDMSSHGSMHGMGNGDDDFSVLLGVHLWY